MTNKIRLQIFLKKIQSLKYQIMILLMEEHRKARINKDSYGTFDNEQRLLFLPAEWEKMLKKINKYLNPANNITTDLIKALFSSSNEYCKLRTIEEVRNNRNNKIEEDIEEIDLEEHNRFKYLVFEITDKGYSYQYNGYKKSEDKLQKTANKFLFFTFIYYILSWFFKSPELTLPLNLNDYFTLIKDYNTTIIYIILIWIIVKISKKN